MLRPVSSFAYAQLARRTVALLLAMVWAAVVEAVARRVRAVGRLVAGAHLVVEVALLVVVGWVPRGAAPQAAVLAAA